MICFPFNFNQANEVHNRSLSSLCIMEVRVRPWQALAHTTNYSSIEVQTQGNKRTIPLLLYVQPCQYSSSDVHHANVTKSNWATSNACHGGCTWISQLTKVVVSKKYDKSITWSKNSYSCVAEFQLQAYAYVARTLCCICSPRNKPLVGKYHHPIICLRTDHSPDTLSSLSLCMSPKTIKEYKN